MSREDLAVILFDYAKYKGLSIETRDDMSKFKDSSSVSDGAKEALAWAVGEGFIQGVVTKKGEILLDAGGSATRAQVATIFRRFCEKEGLL